MYRWLLCGKQRTGLILCSPGTRMTTSWTTLSYTFILTALQHPPSRTLHLASPLLSHLQGQLPKQLHQPCHLWGCSRPGMQWLHSRLRSGSAVGAMQLQHRPLCPRWGLRAVAPAPHQVGVTHITSRQPGDSKQRHQLHGCECLSTVCSKLQAS